MSALQSQAFLDINRAAGLKRSHHANISSYQAGKKAKPTIMTASERIAKATGFIEKDISDHKIVVYAKTWCPHCKKTKELLGGEEFKEVDILIRDLDTMDDPSGPCLSKALSDLTGQTSVPNIFVNGKHFGGNSDIQEAHSNGTLKLS